MKFRWLLALICLLLAACDDSTEESADLSPGEAVKKQSALAENSDPAAETTEPKTPDAEPLSPVDRYTQAQAKFDAKVQEFMTAYRAADEEERKSLGIEYPSAEDYADEFMNLAAEYPDHEVAFDSLYWVVSKVRAGEVAEKAMDKLFAGHLSNESMKNVCTTLGYSTPGSQIESRLNQLIEKSPHESVKASATFALARYLSRLDSTRQYIAENSEIASQYDEESLKYLNDREVEPMAIEALYQTLIADYPELKPREGSKRNYRSMAESALFEINNLAIGMVAPDIEGDDLDGVSFKLSDYRGKVVVLDFWGDW